METQSNVKLFGNIRQTAAKVAVAALCLLGAVTASAALTVNVVGVGPDGKPLATPLTDYRWTVEEDATKLSIPGQPATSANYSFSFHTSYMPVVAAGRVGTTRAGTTMDPDVSALYGKQLPSICPVSRGETCLDPAKRYYISIAADGFQMGAAPIVIDATNGATATVYLNQYPLPTAQVSVFAFNDNNPINGAPDLPQETGLAGFTVQLYEAGGTYGQSGGAVTQDGFGNPLGTTYETNGDVKVKGKGIVLTGADGTAVIKNLFPAKYTVIISPPVGSDWHQTSTIEGTRGSDAWVKNNEPSFFQEFGPPGHHVFIGFTKSGKLPVFADTRTDATTPCAVGVPGCSLQNVLNGANTITGRIINIHNSRTPNYAFEKGAPVPECWVGLNETGGNSRALYATPCKKDSTFTIPNVPNGTYELVVWDDPLDMIIGTQTVTVNNSNLALGDVPVFSWFGRYQGRVFQDINATGLPFFEAPYGQPYVEVDPVTGIETLRQKNFAAGDLKPAFGEGIANNIRFRDGSIYQSVVTKQDGTFAFTELFPFFNWMVAEIDYARFKATGATMIADAGGCIKILATDCLGDPSNKTNEQKLWKAETGSFGSNDPAFAYNPWIRLNPQQQEDGKFYRNENCGPTGQCATLLEGMQTFLGQTNHIEWGKQPYAGQLNGLKNENGGIAGIVHYAITRAEDDPRFAAAENWEPGIPHVQIGLFLDCDGDGKIDKPLNDGTGQCAANGLSSQGYVADMPDVDNYPFGWRDGTAAKGPEDIKRSRVGNDTTFSLGDVFKWGGDGTASSELEVGLGSTDSWDDNIPTGCVKGPAGAVGNGGIPYKDTLDCFDGLYNFNQLRPSVFDGGYAFGRVAGQPELPVLIGASGKGTYIVEAKAPPGYLHQGNGDKNVVFGDSLQVSTAALPFECVGMELPVPEYLTLFPDAANPDTRNPNYDSGQRTWRKCDMKAVPLVPGTNPAPDFHMFTEAPVAGHGVGFILDDTATEFNRFAPTFGEKYAPPHLPVSVQDWTGREITRVYSDQFGSYNFLTPSSFTINPPYPSGVMPSMMVSCMNHPGPIADPSGAKNADGSPKMIIDPYFNRKYTQFCYTLQYLPGKTTYLDTPVLPIAAFANVEKNPLDCECQDKTPAIYSANNPDSSVNSGNNGPWVPSAGGILTIVSAGANVEVPNPAYDPAVTGSPKHITRDYSFGGTTGSVKLGNSFLQLNPGTAWSADLIQVVVPAGTPPGQLTIIRGDNGKESVVGLTVHVGGSSPRTVQPGASIQAVIDDANTHAGDLITIPPGTYNEYLILDKRVRLQGWGANSVAINASKASAGGLAAWRALLNKKVDARCALADGTTPGNPPVNGVCPASTPTDADTGGPTLVAGGNRTFDPLPGQTLGINKSNNEPILFGAEEGAGITVLGKAGNGNGNGNNASNNNRCSGSGNALRIDGLTITGSDSGGGVLASGYNCALEITNNRIVGNYGTYGGGVRVGHTALVDGESYTDGTNNNVVVDHNWIAENGASEIASAEGGGGGVTMGTGSNNYVVSNNYVCGNFSMSDGGGISHVGQSAGANRIFNNKLLFNQTFNQSADPTGGGLFIGGQVDLAGGNNSPGTGDVTVDRNLIQFNHAGAGAGGGVSIARTTNADDVVLTNNMIANNVAAYAGGGAAVAAVSDNVRFVNNTVAGNASTATNRQSFGTNKNQSIAQIAGIARVSGTGPTLLNNVIVGNQAFTWSINKATTPETTGLALVGFRDLGAIGNTVGTINPLASTSSVLTTGSSTSSCTSCFTATAAATFVKPISILAFTDTDQPVVLPESTIMQTALTFDEGGNFINVNFSPLTPFELADGSVMRSDYHLLGTASVAYNSGTNRTTGNNGNRVPVNDFDGQTRPSSTINKVDIGADEIAPALPTVTGLTPAYGLRPGSYSVVLTGTGLGGASLTSSSNGLTVTGVSVNAGGTQINATITVLSNALAGANPLTVATAGGAVVVDFIVTLPPPVVLSAPIAGATVQGTAVPLAATLTNLNNVSRVQFLVNGIVVATDTSSGGGGWTGTWNTVSGPGTTANGPATLTARACGNTSCSQVLGTSAAVVVTVNNVPQGAASFSPNLLDFGNVASNSTTLDSLVTVQNTGTAVLHITAVNVSGGSSSSYYFIAGATNTCTGATLAVNATCQIGVTFHQNNSTFTRNGTLTITDDGNGAHSVGLQGR